MDPYAEIYAGDILLADPRNLYAMWIFLRKVNLPFHIPSWTGLHIKLREKTTITQNNDGYLDCLDAPATDMSTIYHMMQRSVRINGVCVCMTRQSTRKLSRLNVQNPTDSEMFFS